MTECACPQEEIQLCPAGHKDRKCFKLNTGVTRFLFCEDIIGNRLGKLVEGSVTIRLLIQ